MVGIFRPVTLIRHMYARSLVIGAEITERSSCPFGATGAACDEDRVFAFECRYKLVIQININAFLFFRNLRRKRSKLIGWDHAHLMGWHIERFPGLPIVNFVPDALFITVYHRVRDPVGGGIVNTVTSVCKNSAGAPCITNCHSDLA